MPWIWPASLILEAATLILYSWGAGGIGGFPAFRIMLAIDILTQCIEMRYAHSMWAYPWVHRIAEISCEILMVMVVAEAAKKIRGAHYSRSLIIGSAIALTVHLMLWEGVEWSAVAGFVWSSVALSHLLMALFLVLCMTRERSRHASILAVWMLGTAVLFYLAPRYRVGLAVCWWNAVCWTGFTFTFPFTFTTVYRAARSS